MSWFRSLSFRLAALYAGVFTLSIGLLLAIFYWANVDRPMRTVQAQVRLEAEDLRQIYLVEGARGLERALAQRAGARRTRTFFAAWYAPGVPGRLYNLPAIPAGLAPGWHQVDADIYRDGLEFDQLALLHGQRYGDGAALFVGTDVEEIEEFSELVTTAASWVIPLTLVIGLLGGALMSRAIGRRIEAIGSAARAVMAGDLTGRVIPTGGGDDFDQLAGTLNAMLDRLERSFESTRRVADHAAHQLRTPLARLSVELEQARAGEREDRDVRLQQCIEEARRLQTIVDALLRISRLENGPAPRDVAKVDVEILVGDAVELYAPEAEARGLSLKADVRSPLCVQGDADLLMQAITNLIDNAIKYSPDGGAIAVISDGDARSLTVSDEGAGIAPGEAEKLPELFFRGSAGEGADGYGLGLSLVAAIAKVHQARLVLAPKPRGLDVTLAFA